MSPRGSLAVYLVLAAWLPFTLFIFWRLDARLASAVTLVGGWLLLPSATVRLPNIFYKAKATNEFKKQAPLVEL
jgi:hypothetical protein